MCTREKKEKMVDGQKNWCKVENKEKRTVFKNLTQGSSVFHCLFGFMGRSLEAQQRF